MLGGSLADDLDVGAWTGGKTTGQRGVVMDVEFEKMKKRVGD